MRKVSWLAIVGAINLVGPVGCGATPDDETGDDASQRQDEVAGALLPDIVVRESDLHNNYIDATSEPGKVLLRLSNGTANVGAGKLYLYGVTPANPDGTQTVMQRIFAADGSSEDRVAGQFLYHPNHGHVHFDGWAAYRLRTILPDNGVGPVVAEGKKTSFCILDLGIYSSDLPNYNPAGEFHSCGSTVQGLSVGWIDIYGAGLSGQSIDVTGVPQGSYWLESEVDPDNKVLEADETNNATRIQITLGTPPLAQDKYEPNDSPEAVTTQPAGGPWSPNLGPSNPSRVVSGLSIHSATDVDWFRFYANETGGAGDAVRITFDPAVGDLDLELYDGQGTLVASSAEVGAALEEISLSGRPEGWYWAVVRGKSGATNPAYELTVDPPSNAPPQITITAPPAGDVQVVHSFETYTTTWTTSDPESDSTWVTVWLNKTKALDGNQVLMPTSVFTPGEQGFHVVNSAYLTEGTYWVYAEVTDGGTTVGAWSEGTVSFVPNPVCAHEVCMQGAKLNAAVCDPCAQTICAADSYCCTTAWDSVCVGEVATLCNATCPSTTATDAPLAARGAKLTVTGAGLGGTTSVLIGGKSQPISVDSPTQISVLSVSDDTPVGAQPLVVTTNLGSTAPMNVTIANLLVNELDCDQAGNDTGEFVEIATGLPNTTLAGYTLVFFNGGTDKSYFAIDLTGTTDANGLLVVGNQGKASSPALTFGPNLLQNGQDAVAIFQGAAASFPINTPVTSVGLIDALVYDTADADDPVLLAALATDGIQVSESPSPTTKSIKRCGDGRRLGGKFAASTTPNPGQPNGVTCN